MTFTRNASRCTGCWQLLNTGAGQWSGRQDLLCPCCTVQQERHPGSELPVAAFRPDIAALTDDDWVMDPTRLVPVQAGSTTYPPRSVTELARIVANFNNWQLYGGGDKLCTPDGLVVAERLEDAAEGMDAMQWFTAGHGGINWMVFTHGRDPSTCTYTSAFALRRQIAHTFLH